MLFYWKPFFPMGFSNDQTEDRLHLLFASSVRLKGSGRPLEAELCPKNMRAIRYKSSTVMHWELAERWIRGYKFQPLGTTFKTHSVRLCLDTPKCSTIINYKLLIYRCWLVLIDSIVCLNLHADTYTISIYFVFVINLDGRLSLCSFD